MPPAAPEARGRLAASAARLLHAARATLTRQRPSPKHIVIPAKAGTQATTRAFHVAEGAPSHSAGAKWASEAPNKKASATGPLIAFQSLRQPVWTPRDYQAFAREGFMQNAIVYRCVRMIAEAAASVPLLLYAGDDEIAEHPLLRLVSRPNPLQAGPDHFESFYGHLLVSGNAYLEAVAIDGDVREVHALRPDRMKVIPGPDGWPEAYDYTVGGRTIRIATDPVSGVRPILHMRLFHPDNDHYGLSPFEAAASAIDLHNTAAQWNKALLDNSARPSGALVYTARDGNLSAEHYERLKSELEAGFQGSANAGRPLLLEGGLARRMRSGHPKAQAKNQSMSLSPKDMDFIEARHVAAREIALALGVPPMLLGIPGDNTYANLAEAQRIFWRQTVLPLVTRTATAPTNWLAPTYDSNLRLVPDLDAIEALSPERETLWARLEKTSFLTPDEKRAAIGYGPTPAGSRNKFHSPTLTDKFSPTQPRIPAGQPGGGQWTDGDGDGGGVINDVTDVIATVLDQIDIEDIDLGPIDGDIANPRNTIFDDTEPRQPSDLDDLVHPVNRRRGTPSSNNSPADLLRLDAATRQAELSARRTQELDPTWRAPQSAFTRNDLEGNIRHQDAIARSANERFSEITRDAIPGTNPLWGANRLTREMYEQGYRLERPTDSPGLEYRNPAAGEEFRIMQRPEWRNRSDPPEKHYFGNYSPLAAADQAEAALVGAARASRMASSGLRPLRRPVPTMEQMSA